MYGFAGAVLGGLSSPLGAVVGGILVGVFENLVGTYIPGVGNELKLPIALALIVVVLVVKPKGCSAARPCSGSCTHWEGRHEAGAGTCQVFTNR